MGVEDVIKKLQDEKMRCEQDDVLAGMVQIGPELMSATMGGLLEAARLQKQLDEVNEQNSMKPSVARRLNDRIRELEAEITMLRDASRVTELEKKVQRLEAELKQSYATKNYTLKTAILDMEKKYRDYIYSNPDVEELWTEVMLLLVDDKETKEDMLKLRSKHIADLAEQAQARRHSEVSTNETVSEEAAVTVGEQVDALRDSGHLLPVLPLPEHAHKPSRGSPSKASRLSGTIADARASEIGMGAMPAGTSFVGTVREVYAGEGPPALPPMQRHTLSNVAAFTPAGTVDASALQQHKDYISASIDQLRDLFKDMAPPPRPGNARRSHDTTKGAESNIMSSPDARYFDQQVDALTVSVSELMQRYSAVGAMPGEEQTSQGDTPTRGPLGPADASYFDQQTDAVLASIRELQALYSQFGGTLGPGPDVSSTQHPTRFEHGKPDASYFSQQADDLAISIANLRHMYGGQGLPEQPLGSRHLAASTYADTSCWPLGADGLSSVPVDSVSVEDMATLFSSFMGSLERQGICLVKSHRAGGPISTKDGATPEEGKVDEGETHGDAKSPRKIHDVGELAQMFARFALVPGGPLSRPGAAGVALSTANVAGIDASNPVGAAGTASGAASTSYAATWSSSAPFPADGAQAVLVAPGTSSWLSNSHPSPGVDGAVAHTSSVQPVDGLQASESVVAQGAPSTTLGGNATAAVSGGAAAGAGAGAGATVFVACAPSSAAQPPGSVPTVMTRHAREAVGGGEHGALQPAGTVTTPSAAGLSQTLASRGTIAQQLQEQVGPKHASFIAQQPEAMALWEDVLALANKVCASEQQMALAFRGLPTPQELHQETVIARSISQGGASLAEGGHDEYGLARTPNRWSAGGAVAAGYALGAHGSVKADGVACTAVADSGAGHAMVGWSGAEDTQGMEGYGGIHASTPLPGLSEIVPEGTPVMASAILSEDRRSELDQLRQLNEQYAERLAEQASVALMLTEQHQASTERADDLEMRLANATSELLNTKTELHITQDENMELTRLLVDVKMDLAEKDSVTLRLQQRLMRSLHAEGRYKKENEDLRQKIAVLSPEEAGAMMDADFKNSIMHSMAAPNIDQATSPVSRSASQKQPPIA